MSPANPERPVPSFPKLLEVRFEGRFMCRIATDPDPTIESRGGSGYTMALANEPPLDQIIRLQPLRGPDPKTDPTILREPADDLGIALGVQVSGVFYDGEPYAPGNGVLQGTPVNLEGRTKLVAGPSFQSRNNIVGSDDTMAMIVEPFQLAIGRTDTLHIRVTDPLSAAHPDKEAWEFDAPSAYARRFPVSLETNDTEAMNAIGVTDQHGYFWDRRRFLERWVVRCEQARDQEKQEPSSPERTCVLEELDTEIQGAVSRILQIDFWGVRVFNKLGFKTSWKHDITGERTLTPASFEKVLEGSVDARPSAPWTVRYWFGGWDGDLLVGYMRGALSFPFMSDADRKKHPQPSDDAKAAVDAAGQGRAEPEARQA